MPEPKKPVRQKRDPRGDPDDPITSVANTVAEAVEKLEQRIVALQAALAHEKKEREADALMTGQLLARIATLEAELHLTQDVASVLDDELQALEKGSVQK